MHYKSFNFQIETSSSSKSVRFIPENSWQPCQSLVPPGLAMPDTYTEQEVMTLLKVAVR